MMLPPLPASAWPAKPSWPLLVLAGLSFIPGFGILFGGVALTWALLSDRPRRRLAIALSAVGGVLTIVEGVAIAIWSEDDPATVSLRNEATRRDLAKIVEALEDHRGKEGAYPATLKELVGAPIPRRFLNINDQSAGIFKMRPYEYHLSTEGTYELFAVGADGKAGTMDDIQPPARDTLSPPKR
jgi:type II secretion system (T2SS) protein G